MHKGPLSSRENIKIKSLRVRQSLEECLIDLNELCQNTMRRMNLGIVTLQRKGAPLWRISAMVPCSGSFL